MSVCLSCSTRLARTHTFCPRCGARAATLTGTEASPRTPVHPSRVVAAKRHRAPPLGLLHQSEHKQVSVLFVDLCESTAHVASVEPEEARACLDEALHLMTSAVGAYGGTVSQLLGDGLLALFGAPVAQDDHALRACLAALAMHSGSRGRNGTCAGRPFVLRVGIHSGEVIAGLTGQHLWSLYRADGTTIHVASRLEKLAEPGCVWISETTERLIAGQLATKPLGLHRIRGAGFDLRVYELLPGGVAAAAPRVREHSAPLVGRDEPLRMLGALAATVRSGAMRVVGLRGDPGIGKSRLIDEWCASPVLDGFAVCATHARGYSMANSYGVIAETARHLAAFNAWTPRRAGASAAAGGPHDIESERASAINDLLNVADSAQAWLTLTPAVRRRRIADALLWLVAEGVRTKPLLMIFEDVFLADRESRRLLEWLVPRLDGLPVLICLSYRQDLEHSWSEAPWFVEHWLAPLHKDEMDVLGQSLLGMQPSVAPLIGELVDRADGNPFFLEQLILTLVDDGSLAGAPGHYHLTRQRAELRVPGSIAAVISTRVDRLPAPAKSALEAAAILGDPITPEVVGDMQRLDAAAALELLRAAVASGLLSAPAAMPAAPNAFSFRHALVQEVVVGTLTRPRRRALHRAACLALQRWYGANVAEHAATLARHAFDGEQWPEAAAYACKAIAREVSRSANRDALRLLEIGIDASRRVADRRQALALELDLLLQVLGALMALGHIDTIFENLERANALATELGDLRCRATVLLQTSVFQWMRGRFTQGLENAKQAHDAGRRADRRNLQMAAAQTAMMMLHGLGRYDEAKRAAEAVLRDFEPELAQNRLMVGWATAPIINLLSFYSDALTRLGAHAAAQAACNRAYAVLACTDHPYSRGLIDYSQGRLWIDVGRFDDAVALMRASVAMCTERDVPTLMPCNMAVLGAALQHSGQAAEAVQLLQRAIDNRLDLPGGVYVGVFLRLHLGSALCQLGRHAEAITWCEQAVELAVASEQHGHRSDALLELGVALHHAGAAERARRCVRESLALARQSAMPLLVVRAEALLETLGEPELAVS